MYGYAESRSLWWRTMASALWREPTEREARSMEALNRCRAASPRSFLHAGPLRCCPHCRLLRAASHECSATAMPASAGFSQPPSHMMCASHQTLCPAACQRVFLGRRSLNLLVGKMRSKKKPIRASQRAHASCRGRRAEVGSLAERLYYEMVIAQLGDSAEVLYVSVANAALAHLPYLIALDHHTR